jgi:2-oxoglutarate ferredoxin oxidoreductase subunit alpha
MADFVFEGFRLADKYRNPAMILADGALGQMMEKVLLPPEGSLPFTAKPWATTGKPENGERRILTSLHLEPEKMEEINIRLQDKYRKMKEDVRYELIGKDKPEIVLVAFGLIARICQKAIELAKERGINVALLRPITLYPFPSDAIHSLAATTDAFLTVEMNAGQMVEDVKLAVNGERPVYFKGRMGGMIPSPEEILFEIEAIAEKHQTTKV